MKYRTVEAYAFIRRHFGQDTDIMLSSEYQQTLREQIINEDGPGSVLRDFGTLLDFVGRGEIKVSGVHQLLPMSALAELNARLSKPLRVLLRRPQQKSYPHINGLYLLLRASGLSLVEVKGRQPLLALLLEVYPCAAAGGRVVRLVLEPATEL